MKNILFMIISIVVLSAESSAQQNWEWVTPYPSAGTAVHSCQAGGKVFYKVSGYGFYSTADGGNSFSGYESFDVPENSSSLATLDKIAFADSLTGFIVDNKVYKTTDGGKNWSVFFNQSQSVNMVEFADEDYGWLLGSGGIEYKTTDGGETWANIEFNGLYDIPGPIYSIYALDKNRLWVCKQFNYDAGGTICYSSDGGYHWAAQECPGSDSTNRVYYKDLHVNQSGIGFATASVLMYDENPHYEPLLVKTTNFGTEWVPIPVDGNFFPVQVISKSDDEWLILGSSDSYTSAYIKTSDGGLTWEYKDNIFSGINSNDNAATAEYLSSSNTLLVSGWLGIYRSFDFGNTLPRLSDKNEIMIDGFAIDRHSDSAGQNVIAVSDRDSFIVSSDGGRTWQKKFLKNGRNFKSITAAAGGTIFTLQDDHHLYKSSDLGETWEDIFGRYIPVISLNAFSSEDITLLIYQYSGIPSVISTKDGGINWETAPYFDSYKNYMETPFEDKIYVCGVYPDSSGERGYIYNSDDNGRDWNVFDTEEEMITIKAVSRTIALAISKHNLYRTTDNGKSWTLTYHSGLNYSNLSFTDTLNGMISIGYNLFKTSNAGRTWAASGLNMPFSSDWKFMEYNKYGDLILAGRNGMAVYRNPDYHPEEKNLNAVSGEPQDCLLFQNYPNPFNPNTLIKYKTNNGGLVQLKVYDILGREVETLVNAQQPAGKYSVEFNGSKLSSGIYFFRLTAGDFAQMKKMILMK